jgi:hypothetical protein
MQRDWLWHLLLLRMGAVEGCPALLVLRMQVPMAWVCLSRRTGGGQEGQCPKGTRGVQGEEVMEGPEVCCDANGASTLLAEDDVLELWAARKLGLSWAKVAKTL